MVARSEGLKTPALPKTHLHTHCLGFLVPGPYAPSVCPQISNKPHGSPVPHETPAGISRYEEKETDQKDLREALSGH